MQEHCIRISSNICFGYLLELPHWGNSNKYPKHMLYEEIRIKTGLSNISFCPVRILYNSTFIIMATSFGTNVVVTRVHCTFATIRQMPFFNQWKQENEYDRSPWKLCGQAGIQSCNHWLLYGAWPFLKRRQYLWCPLCFPAHQVPPKNGCTPKGKNLFPGGANSFLLDRSFFKGEAKLFWKSYPPPWKIYRFPLNVDQE